MKKATLQEFLTPKRTLVLKNVNGRKTRTYQLGNYNLSFHQFLYYEFATEKEQDGAKIFIDRLTNNDPKAALKAIYWLIEDKEDFPTFEDFTKALDSYKFSIHEIQLLLTAIFSESLPNYRKKKIGFFLLKMILLTGWTGIVYMIS